MTRYILNNKNISYEPINEFEYDLGSGRADSETSMIPSDDDNLKKFASLLQINEQQMRKWLCNRKIVTARESYDTPMNAKAVSRQVSFMQRNFIRC